MYICDGSMFGSNLGVNPSLTIAALTEHAMSHIPVSGEQKWDAIGEEIPL
jgi:cholesterol oxidase